MIFDSIKDIYISNNKPKTWEHVQEVAETAVWLAEKYGLEQEKVKIAALLHDVSAIMSPQEMYDIAVSRNMYVDPAEEKYHFLFIYYDCSLHHYRRARMAAAGDSDGNLFCSVPSSLRSTRSI